MDDDDMEDLLGEREVEENNKILYWGHKEGGTASLHHLSCVSIDCHNEIMLLTIIKLNTCFVYR